MQRVLCHSFFVFVQNAEGFDLCSATFHPILHLQQTRMARGECGAMLGHLMSSRPFCACKENVETFKASPGCAVLGLRLHNGRGLVLKGRGLHDASMFYIDLHRMLLYKLKTLVNGFGAKELYKMNYSCILWHV